MLVNNATLAAIEDTDAGRFGDWITVFSGKKYYSLDPREEDVDIKDIAHSLSLLCRYNGHCLHFYSVAEHSVLMSYAVPDQYKLEALLHDASEAYTSDIPRPIKHSPELYLFRQVEDLNAKVIYSKYGIPFPESETIKEFDRRIIHNECKVLFDGNVTFYEHLQPIEEITIECWSPAVAEQKFLERFYELTLR